MRQPFFYQIQYPKEQGNFWRKQHLHNSKPKTLASQFAALIPLIQW